ncbi:hypothetical protein WMF30_35645 [Sorangium sp. So ce134]
MSAVEPETAARPPAAPHRRVRAHVYRRPPEPVYFPESEEVPETNRHLEHRTALYLTLKRELAHVATLGSDQFVYGDPTTPRKRLAPDAFVRLGMPHRTFRTWKTWMHGAPDLGVEVVSESDEGEPEWDEKPREGRLRAPAAPAFHLASLSTEAGSSSVCHVVQ